MLTVGFHSFSAKLVIVQTSKALGNSFKKGNFKRERHLLMAKTGQGGKSLGMDWFLENAISVP